MTEHLLVGWWGYALFTCSVLICASYQIIPRGLVTIEDHGRNNENSRWLLGVTSSVIFRAFIRACGWNHPLMSGVMIAAANGWIISSGFWRGVLLAGEGLVAVVSVLSALAVWKTKWHLVKIVKKD